MYFPKPALLLQFQFCQVENRLFNLKHGQCQNHLSGKCDSLENTVSHLLQFLHTGELHWVYTALKNVACHVFQHGSDIIFKPEQNFTSNKILCK